MLGLKSLLVLAIGGGAAAGRAVTVDSGALGGAPFAIAVPPEGSWNHGVVLLAHDHRTASLPPLAVDPSESELGRTLVSQGWIVAASGYRRNGIIIADAVTDLLDLRTYLGLHYGSINRTIVVGDGLGGFVAALIAERTPDQVSAAVAIDPPLTVHEANQAIGLSLDPKVPLVLVATAKAPLAEATAYKISQMPRPPEDPLPALLAVARDGRDNVNDAERLAAVRVANAWLQVGPQSLPETVPNQPYADITVAPPERARLVTAAEGQPGFTAHVLAVDPLNGSFQLDARPADFAERRIETMGYFEATFGGASSRVMRQPRGARVAIPGQKPKPSLLSFLSSKKGTSGSSAPAFRGEWIAYDDAEGYVTLARNDEDQPATATLQVGDPVAIATFREVTPDTP